MGSSCAPNVLILRNGGENNCSTLVKSYIGRHEKFEEKLIDSDCCEVRKQDCQNKKLVVLLCRGQQRLEDHQDKMISKLSRYLDKSLVVIYFVSKGPAIPYYATGASKLTTQIHVSLENLDERLITNTLKSFLNITSENERPKNFFVFLFCGVLLAVFYLAFKRPEIPEDEKRMSTIAGPSCEINYEYRNDLELRLAVLQNNMTEHSQKLEFLQEENQVLRVEIEASQKRTEKLEELVDSLKYYLCGLLFLLISYFLFQIMEIKLPFAKTFFKKRESVFKKGREQDDAEKPREKYVAHHLIQATKNFVKSGSLDSPADGQNENDSTESSVEAVELEEAVKLMTDGSIEETIPATEENLIQAKSFSAEK